MSLKPEEPTPLARLFPPPVLRLAVIICVFALILRVINPTPSAAPAAPGPVPADTVRSSGKAPARDPQGRWLLGTLVSARHEVWIYSDGVQPVYTVADRTGRILRAALVADEVYRDFPDLPVDQLRMHTTPGGAIMHAESPPAPGE